MKKTMCNPIAIKYAYQKGLHGREAADPAVVIYKDTYFLFASHCGGYWSSSDMVNWHFIRVDLEKQPQFKRFAPATLVIGDRLYLTFSEHGTILYSDTPHDPESWVDIGKAFDWNDPAFFLDDDGSVYIYEGCSNACPLRAARLDPENNMRLMEGPTAIFAADPHNRGYERLGDFNEREDHPPYLEGAWLNKINGKYYLTYAVPGTEFSTYADGCAVADSPMGPFVNCPNSPVTYKATGFVRGAGHGALFTDKNGNYWKVDTSSISKNHAFERRICLFPAKVGSDGNLYTNTYRGDYPMLYPHDVEDPFSRLDAGWHLLSWGKAVRASSVLDDHHKPCYVADENMKTWWSAKSGDVGEWLEMDLGKPCAVYSLQVNFADQDIEDCEGLDHPFSYKYLIESSRDGSRWSILVDQRDNQEDYCHEYFQLDEHTTTRYIRITNCGAVPAGGKFSISGLRLFGNGGAAAPSKAPTFQVTRCQDERDVILSWEAVPHAEGYLIRFGVNPNELHTHWQVVGETDAKLRCLIRGVTYYFTIDAYNDSGITTGTEILSV